MSSSMLPVAAVLLAYVVGSFPTAFLVGKANGIDLRTVGSGNLGATNVQRTLGWSWGLLVYAVDFLKGLLPTLLLPATVSVDRGWPWGVAMGLAAIAGHVKPVFLMGKGGGKGVATASGVFLALAPWPTIAAIGTFLVVVMATRFVSLGSMVAAVVLAAVLLLQQGGVTPLALVGVAVAGFVIWTHRENIGRLRRGEERRLGTPKAAESAPS